MKQELINMKQQRIQQLISEYLQNITAPLTADFEDARRHAEIMYEAENNMPADYEDWLWYDNDGYIQANS